MKLAEYASPYWPCQDLRQLYEDQQLGIVAIGQRLGVSASTVANRLRRCGIPLRSGRFTRRDISVELLTRLYLRDELPLREIAASLQVSIGTVINRRRALGLPPRSRGRRPRGPKPVGP